MKNFKMVETKALYIILGSQLTKQHWRKKGMMKKKRLLLYDNASYKEINR